LRSWEATLVMTHSIKVRQRARQQAALMIRHAA
jgi:hypothetical protein